MDDRQLFAAVDLGSNSFHMIVARLDNGQLRVIDRIKDMVRIGGGLDSRGRLDGETRERAIASLARFGQRIAGIPDQQIRAVGTQTFRRLRNPAAFLVVAETALGCPIDIVSGREEARLVYLGVGQGMPAPAGKRLVIDIGGGSTELVVGASPAEPGLAESLGFGCVAVTRSLFPDGRVTAARWQRGLRQIGAELQAHAESFRRFGWDEAVGSSGTIRAVADMITELDPEHRRSVTPAGLAELRRLTLDVGDTSKLELASLSEQRRPVIAGGMVVLEAVMNVLEISELAVSDFALREGLLHDLLGRLEDRDPREQTVRAMGERYKVDRRQAERIDDWTRTAFEQVAEAWALSTVHADMLHWISQLHEIGLAIAHDNDHLHAGYILEHADMPGFGRQEQQFLACLARLQKRRILSEELSRLPARLQGSARRLLALLRLGLAMNRARNDRNLTDFGVSANAELLSLALPTGWLDAHPLTRQDLEFEQQQLERIGIALTLRELDGSPLGL
ncbi:MAG: Ppx/GppA family phosphatase [Wenzhouxiangella sp.]|nr:Ppx/GppA family phosphatase [Wenzhouxiangella sp.]